MMKRISTTGMDSAEAHRLMGNLVGSSGNENIRGCHIDYFEKRVSELKEDQSDSISSAPNYYGWLWLMAEHVFWSMREFWFRENVLQDNYLDHKNVIEVSCEPPGPFFLNVQDPGLMVIADLYLICGSFPPNEADPPLLIDTDAVLTLPIPLQSLKPKTR